MLKNDGWRVDKDTNIIYVDKRIDGRRVKFSTGKKATPANLKWIKQNWQEVLLNHIDKKKHRKVKVSSSLYEFGLFVINSKKDIKEATRKDHIATFKKHIIPYFKDFGIDEIETIDIEMWQNMLLEKMSSRTVKKAKEILGRIFTKAMAYKIIEYNPILASESFVVTYSHTENYTDDEVGLILSKSKGWLRAFLYVAFTSGMRAGEIIGLKWSDVDLENSVIFLKRSISKGIITETTSTKNHNRLVILPSVTVDILREYQKATVNKEWVFPSTRGNRNFYDASTVRKHFKKFAKSIGIKYRALKPTRHTYISIMRNRGASDSLTSEIAGHSVKVSNQFYYSPKITQHKVDVVNNVFGTSLVQVEN